MSNKVRKERRGNDLIMAGLCLAMVIACLDSSVVSTCGPEIIADIGGGDSYSWILTAYLLCETIMIPISGKLSDIFGRKPFFFVGLLLFVIGSIAAGMSTHISRLIACRAVQGLGGGILIPVVTAAVGDLYTGSERAKMQGLLGAMFGIGSGLGPLVGGYLTTYFSWHWAFFVNVPLVAICALLIFRNYPTSAERGDSSVDYRGITVLSMFLLDLLLLLHWANDEFEWVSIESAVMGLVAVMLLAVFIHVEKRVKAPTIDPKLIRNGVVVKSSIFMLIFGFAMMGASTYISFFGINVLGFTAMEAGEYGMAMVAGMMISSIASSSLLQRTEYRLWLIMGPILSAIGLYMMAQVDQDVTSIYLVACLFVFGLGLGCIMSIVLVAVQESSRPDEIGMTTSSVNLLRNIGTTMGTAIFATIINNGISSRLDSDHTLDMVNQFIPHNTDIVYAWDVFPLSQFKDTLVRIFIDSVDFAFVFAAAVLMALTLVGIVFKAKKPREE